MKSLSKMLALLLLLPACSYRTEKETPGLGLSNSNLSFSDVQSRILGPRCARCHAGDVVASYEAVAANLSEITRRIQLSPGTRGAMPPGAPLSAAEREALLAWARAGAPRESGSTAPNPSTPPVPTPPTPENPAPFSFAEVQSKVLTPKCARCHGGMMGSYERVVANLGAIDSMVSAGQMPPARAAQLSEDEKQLLLRWIAMGAPKEGEAANPAPPPAPRPCHVLSRHGDHEGDDDHDDDHDC